MNKQELVDKATEIASTALERTITKKDADAIITATVEAIMGAVAEGEKVTLVGFGVFERRDRKEREGRNPKTGDTMVIPATMVPAFSAGKLFKERVKPAEAEPAPAKAKAKSKKK
ncbi:MULTISPECIES: HU family DNA-binding protein [Cyanophyceae]|uniref:HU family DNA-binding protein n=1 Tax=Cyanophyceae TaxID=3028117 RepID=UPI00168714D4|nr:MULTISPECIES: HU family DNA-binding protein [Cyanophyceae]MBD1918872.1 HU family DNA-binding protein [Phormidium sp. FACHB-77]MBD2033286.1 HU family DNA-binding protein [Phormidium sp. FACHB-322]MBD2053781.1 HU family DNA-binding protein [Leptolyngbya sp. FACHB-60]